MSLNVKLLSDLATLPERKTCEAAGYDICSIEEVVLKPGSYKLVSTGLSFTVPIGTYGQLAPRSGLACKGIHVGAGVIDRDYTGHVKVLLFNLSDDELILKQKERIAQLIIHKIETPNISKVDELVVSDRGDGGFGSTGKL
jgi:dUTP pyrophosphatase